MSSLQEVFCRTKTELKKYYADSLELESILKILFCKVCYIEFTQFALHTDIKLNFQQIKNIKSATLKLKKQMPIQYILKEAFFYNLSFYVSKKVLIPRAETEEIFEILKQQCAHLSFTNAIDICTGSACIAIALKKIYPTINVSAIDISTSAIKVAMHNATIHRTQINFYKYNFLTQKHFNKLNTPFDLVICNPPYIILNEKQEMNANVLKYEPHKALFVKDNNPLIFIEKIYTFCNQFLKTEGIVIVEINPLFFKDIQSLFESDSVFHNVTIIKDLFKKNRFLYAQKK